MKEEKYLQHRLAHQGYKTKDLKKGRWKKEEKRGLENFIFSSVVPTHKPLKGHFRVFQRRGGGVPILADFLT